VTASKEVSTACPQHDIQSLAHRTSGLGLWHAPRMWLKPSRPWPRTDGVFMSRSCCSSCSKPKLLSLHPAGTEQESALPANPCPHHNKSGQNQPYATGPAQHSQSRPSRAAALLPACGTHPQVMTPLPSSVFKDEGTDSHPSEPKLNMHHVHG